MIYELKDASKVEGLFGDWELPEYRDYLKPVEIKFFVTDPQAPRSAMMLVDDVTHYAGEPDRELVVAGKPKGLVFMTPQTEGWAKLIEECFPDAEKKTRYAIKRQKHFDRENLGAMIKALPAGYELKKIDPEIYDLCLQVTDPDLADLVSEFDSKEAFFDGGRGFVILKEGRVVSGAASCLLYRDGIEIEIDTDKTERRRGLASAAGAALILSCLDDGLEPRWDAANMNSVHLAEKLGYEFSHAYVYYRVSGIFDKPFITPDKSNWASFCGKYECLFDEFHLCEVFMKDGDLYGIVTDRGDDGDLTFKLYPIGENKFGRAGGTVEITFGENCLVIENVTCKKL